MREFKKLRRQPQRIHHIKIELCDRFSALRLFHVSRGLLLRVSVDVRTSSMKISRRRLAEHVKKNCTKKRAARAARFSFLSQPMILLICDVAVSVAFVGALTP